MQQRRLQDGGGSSSMRRLQMKISQSVKRARALLREMDTLRDQVADVDLQAFDNAMNPSRRQILDAIDMFKSKYRFPPTIPSCCRHVTLTTTVFYVNIVDFVYGFISDEDLEDKKPVATYDDNYKENGEKLEIENRQFMLLMSVEEEKQKQENMLAIESDVKNVERDMQDIQDMFRDLSKLVNVCI